MQSRSSQDTKGIDVSHYQGTIHWNEVHNSGIDFAYIKATEGMTYRDPDFSANFSNSRSAGVLRGGYHFARPASGTAVGQANFFIQVLKSQSDIEDLPPALDLEDNGGKNAQELTDWVDSFVTKVHEQIGLDPVLYVSPSFAEAHLTSAVANLSLWVADWGVSSPPNFSGWHQWTFWQYSDTGQVTGITGNVDLDVYAGSRSNLQQLAASRGGTSSASSGQSSHSVQPPTLKLGDTGNYVSDIQLLLYKVGQHPNGVTGQFTANTKISVEDFQKQVGIAQTGTVDRATWTHLVDSQLAQRPKLKLYDAGQQVTDLQYLLKYRGEDPGPIDGIFATATETAIKKFQSKSQLSATGTADMSTWKALIDKLPKNVS